MYKIMIVEDDQTVSSLIAETFKKWDIKPIMIDDFNEIMTIFEQNKPDLVLMDINLPVYDGFHWNQEIRKQSSVPIIFISSRNTNMDMVMAMNMGADDYVAKPFSTEVLMAKINALLRRTHDYAEAADESLEHKGFVLNLASGGASYQGQQIDLSKNEYKLMQIMLRQTGQVITRENLLRAMWADERFVDDNTLTVNVNRIRKKLEAVGLSDFILTKVGQGYIIP